MRINRALLYGGIFLVAVGGVLVTADASTIDSATLADAIRLWPLAVIAIGAGLVLRRTRFSLGGGLVAAAMPGLLIGSGLAILPRFPGDCGVREEPAIARTDAGTFLGGGVVTVRGGCGSLVVTTLPGSDWRLDSGNTAGRTPVISADEHSLSISGGRGWNALNAGRDRWSLAVPTVPLEVLALSLNAGDGRATLTGAHIGLLEVNANLSDVAIDAWGADLDGLDVALKWSNASLHLPGGARPERLDPARQRRAPGLCPARCRAARPHPRPPARGDRRRPRGPRWGLAEPQLRLGPAPRRPRRHRHVRCRRHQPDRRMQMNRRLYRCRENRVLAGVASGVAEFFGLDPTLVRVVWFLSIFAGGFTLLLYIAPRLHRAARADRRPAPARPRRRPGRGRRP